MAPVYTIAARAQQGVDARSAIFCPPVSTDSNSIMSHPSFDTPATRSITQPHGSAANDSAARNPCISCGACCAYFRVSFYCGEIADGHGGGMVPPELVVQVAPLRAAMKGTEYGRGRCIALRGEIGSPDVHCSIHPLRPSPCREFNPWRDDGTPDPDCQRVRAMFGLPPLPPLTDDLDPPAHAA